MFIVSYGFIVEALASYYDAIIEVPELFNLVEEKRGRLIAWQLGVIF